MRTETSNSLARVSKALEKVDGKISTSTCGCVWKRVAPWTFRYYGCWICGDVLVRYCAHHAWYHRQPPAVRRRSSRQERARGEESRT